MTEDSRHYPAGTIHLGQGQSDGVEWELCLWPSFPNGPLVVCWGGGSHPSDRLDRPLGSTSISIGNGEGDGILVLRGEIQAGYDHVDVECQAGEIVGAEIVDCLSHFGFNYYIAVLRSRPARVVARSATGDTASRSW